MLVIGKEEALCIALRRLAYIPYTVVRHGANVWEACFDAVSQIQLLDPPHRGSIRTLSGRFPLSQLADHKLPGGLSIPDLNCFLSYS